MSNGFIICHFHTLRRPTNDLAQGQRPPSRGRRGKDPRRPSKAKTTFFHFQTFIILIIEEFRVLNEIVLPLMYLSVQS